jgi:hypothetical protein
VPQRRSTAATTKPCPAREYIAPRAKSACPPDPDQYWPATVSDAACPTKSTSVVALIEMNDGSWAMTLGSLTQSTGSSSTGCVAVEEVVQAAATEAKWRRPCPAAEPCGHP